MPEQAAGLDGAVLHAAEGQRDEHDDDEGVEDDAGEDRGVGVQPHDVECAERGVGAHERRGDDGEVLGHVVGDAEGRERAAGHQQLLADLDDLDELGGVGIQVHHVARFLGGLRAAVHRDGDIGLRERGCVVGAVAGHGDESPALLILADELQFGLGRGLGEKVVDARFRRDRGSRHRIVAGDHDGLDTHAAEFGEALGDATLDDVLEFDDAEGPALPVGHDQRRGASLRDLVHDLAGLHARRAAHA